MFKNVTISPLSEDNVSSQVKWMSLFHIDIPGDMTPPIIVNPYPDYMIKYYCHMVAYKLMNDIWEPFTLEELNVAALEYYADLNMPGQFDMSISLATLGQKLCENRPITRCELILAMKCPYLKAHRLHAISTNFSWTSRFTNNIHTCNQDKSVECICSYIKFM